MCLHKLLTCTNAPTWFWERSVSQMELSRYPATGEDQRSTHQRSNEERMKKEAGSS